METTHLEVSPSLRRSGIHAVLGIRLPPRRKLVGVLYIGLREKRSFTRREVARLQTLGGHLTLHLDNAQLYADLRARIEELGVERDLRERFVAIVAHDRRGPLSTAKMISQLLIRRPERLDERSELAVRLERNLERVEHMIRDLLDVSRVRAGQKLPLQLESCDLDAVAEEVVRDLRDNYGDRFRLLVPQKVRGFWSRDEVRRALWNLSVNAVKYGAPDSPITIRVEEDDGGGRVSVHNFGQAIPAEDQPHLFDAYARLHTATRRGSGWGLGLALVRACADAHGGTVQVESSPDAGTTFSLSLPGDAGAFH